MAECIRPQAGPLVTPDDGYVSSHEYAARSKFLGTSGDGGFLDMDFQHPLERWIARDFVRRLLGYLSRRRPGRPTAT